MKKIKVFILIMLAVFTYRISFSQTLKDRSNSVFTQVDQRLKAEKNLVIPTGSGVTFNDGLSLSGSIFYRVNGADTALYIYDGSQWNAVGRKLLGTPNQINVSSNGNTFTLSAPQRLDTLSNFKVNSLGVGGSVTVVGPLTNASSDNFTNFTFVVRDELNGQFGRALLSDLQDSLHMHPTDFILNQDSITLNKVYVSGLTTPALITTGNSHINAPFFFGVPASITGFYRAYSDINDAFMDFENTGSEMKFNTSYNLTAGNKPYDFMIGGISHLRIESGGIKTSVPSGGTAQFWKLGSKVTAGVSFDAGNYLQVEVNGVVYKLALVN